MFAVFDLKNDFIVVATLKDLLISQPLVDIHISFKMLILSFVAQAFQKRCQISAKEHRKRPNSFRISNCKVRQKDRRNTPGKYHLFLTALKHVKKIWSTLP
jgi:hypothetical protein